MPSLFAALRCASYLHGRSASIQIQKSTAAIHRASAANDRNNRALNMYIRRPKILSRTPKTRGQSTIELALVVTLVLVPLLIGVADIARAYYEHLAVAHAANVAARWQTLVDGQRACVRTYTGFNSVTDVARADLSTTMDPSRVLNVVESNVSQSNGSAVQVIITYQHNLLFGMFGNGSLTLKAQSQMPGRDDTTGVYTCPTPFTSGNRAQPVPSPTNTPVSP